MSRNDRDTLSAVGGWLLLAADSVLSAGFVILLANHRRALPDSWLLAADALVGIGLVLVGALTFRCRPR